MLLSVGFKAKLLPTVLWLMEGPKIQKADGSKIPMTWSQKEDNRRIPKMDRPAWTKKVRWNDINEPETELG